MDFSQKEEERLTLRDRDLLVCEGGDIGRTAMWRGALVQCYYQNHLHRLRRKADDIVPEFVMCWMEFAVSRRRLYEGAGNKTTIPNLSKSRLAEFRIPLPAPEEQRAIARVLRVVQRAKEACEQILDATRQLEQSLLRHLFTFGTVPVAQVSHVLLQDTEVGAAPAHWSAGTLGGFFTLQRGFDLPQQDRRPGSVPIVSSSGMSGFHDEAKVNGPGVVTGRYGTIGAVYYIEKDFWPLNTTLFVREFGDNDPRFVAFFLKTLNLASFNDKTSVPGINRNHVHAMKVAVPPLLEQREIARQLAAVDASLAAGEARRAAVAALYTSLLDHLMTGRVRVPFDGLREGAA